MSKINKITKGLDIKLKGKAEKIIMEVFSDKYALKPTDFIGVFPKLMVKEGDEVKAGTPVFFDKYRENIIFTSPVSGKITEIKRGERRVIQEIRIAADKETKYVSFDVVNPNDLSKEEISEKLLKSGLWPWIRQRPYSIIANPAEDPKAIFISAFDSSPLAPDYDFIVHNKGGLFQTGLDALAKLTSGKIHLNLNANRVSSKVFSNSKNVQINQFAGPHPAGNIGIQIHKIDPINKGEIVWYITPQGVLTIGRLFIEGKYNAAKTIALSGSEVSNPRYYKILSGSAINPLLKNNVQNGNNRYISGNVLTGRKIEKDGYISFYDSQITVITEGDEPEFLGWGMPGLGKYSVSRSFISWLCKNKEYRLDTNYHGCERAFVMTGQYEDVFPMNIMPVQLLKSILVQDIDMMENLGIYEVDEEDFALCEFVCTSKIEVQSIIRDGLNMILKEMS